MKALIKRYPKPGIWLEDVAIPQIGKNDVLVKIKKTAICGTDVHIYKWDEWSQQTIQVPMIIGHEFVGEIAVVGGNVHEFKVGELVSGEGHVVCDQCRNCLAGRKHLCRSTSGIGVNRSGAFAEYLSIPASNIWRCDPRIPEDVLACFDPFGNAVHTALSFDLLGEDVLITGAGPIGIMAVAVAKHAGARYVVITDVNDFRLDLAKRMGATRAINANNDTIENAFNELGMKEGFDVGMEMSGNPMAFQSLIKNMYHGGKIAILGIQKPETVVDWNAIVFNSLTIKGIYGREMFETWYKMTSMILSGLDISPVITHHFHYTEYEKAFDVMASGQSGKVILNWDDKEAQQVE